MADSKLGQTVSRLCKYEQDGDVKTAASEVKKLWAARVAAAAKEKGAKPEPAASDAKPAVKSEEVKPEVKPEPPAAAASSSVAAESSSSSGGAKTEAPGAVKLERMESKSAVSWRPAMPTGDQTRDVVRQKLQEAFDKGKADNERFLHEQETDTAAMAEEAEQHMFDVFDGSSTKEYKTRFRSLAFNLKDPKNPHFIKAIVTGQVHVNDLATMEVRDMASEEMKRARSDAAEIAKMALMDDRTYKNYSGKKDDAVMTSITRGGEIDSVLATVMAHDRVKQRTDLARRCANNHPPPWLEYRIAPPWWFSKSSRVRKFTQPNEERKTRSFALFDLL